jgi:hypothetical protein
MAQAEQGMSLDITVFNLDQISWSPSLTIRAHLAHRAGWSFDAPDGELLYIAMVIIDEWSLEKAETYAARGYVHYPELVSVADGSLHPTKVGWFKHIGRTSFTLDGGPLLDLARPVVMLTSLKSILNQQISV